MVWTTLLEQILFGGLLLVVLPFVFFLLPILIWRGRIRRQGYPGLGLDGATHSPVPRLDGSTHSPVPRLDGSTHSPVPRLDGSTHSPVPRKCGWPLLKRGRRGGSLVEDARIDPARKAKGKYTLGSVLGSSDQTDPIEKAVALGQHLPGGHNPFGPVLRRHAMAHATLLWSNWQDLLQRFAWGFSRPGYRRFAGRLLEASF